MAAPSDEDDRTGNPAGVDVFLHNGVEVVELGRRKPGGARVQIRRDKGSAVVGLKPCVVHQC
jgi:hypothetical protein